MASILVYKDVQGMKIGQMGLFCRILSHLYRGSIYYEVICTGVNFIKY